MIPSVNKGTPAWPELREVGVAWWVKNDNTLRKLIEKVAKAAFQVKDVSRPGSRTKLDLRLINLGMIGGL
jgi:hypothetical protein